MLEKAKEKTREEPCTKLEYARFADDIVVLINWRPSNKWLVEAVQRRIKEELEKLQVELNEHKSRVVDLTKDEALPSLVLNSAVLKAGMASGGRITHHSNKSESVYLKTCSGYLPPISHARYGKLLRKSTPNCEGIATTTVPGTHPVTSATSAGG